MTEIQCAQEYDETFSTFLVRYEIAVLQKISFSNQCSKMSFETHCRYYYYMHYTYLEVVGNF